MLQYWSFYWPLALNGAATVLAVQLQNGTLARYPDAATELASFALAMSTFGLFNAAQNFVPQLANVYARSRGGHRRSYAFVAAASALLATPLLLLVLTPAGAALLGGAYGIDGSVRAAVLAYLALLTPMVLVNGQRHFFTGLLIQARRTRTVTVLNIGYLTSMLLLLVAGFRLATPPAAALMGALLASACAHAIALRVAVALAWRVPQTPEHEHVRWTELLQFFVPVTTTGVMFALSRPVLYAFVARTPEGLVSIAALRVGFDFAMLFQQAANQFRHFFVTFGLDDLAGKRRFMLAVGAGITLIMLLLAATAGGGWLLSTLLGVRGEVLVRAQGVILVMTLLPSVIIVRNYFHGILMVRRRTAGMAWGSMLRVAAVCVMAASLAAAGWLNHLTGAAAMIIGMVVETLVVLRAARRSDSAEA